MRKLLLTTTALAFCAAGAAPAFAEFTERTIRVSNGINADHPVGNGIEAMQKCLDEKSGGKLKLQAFWGGALGGDLQATQALRSGVQEAVVTSSSSRHLACSICPSCLPMPRKPIPFSTASSAT